ncbi:hypothetical protein [Shinella zoogloeoides]|uniref:hypothetical protein n=1 Tax=Shinella zoogloeoides TaxID=352475 RepID=UPI0028B01E6C|nr:hypothetical protein [Shinella zoogloeoides]
MSATGTGHVQKAVLQSFAANPDRRISVPELVIAAYGSEQSTKPQRQAVIRAADRLASTLGFQRRRISGQVFYVLPTTAMRLQREAFARLQGVTA